MQTQYASNLLCSGPTNNIQKKNSHYIRNYIKEVGLTDTV